jgi:EmrB/QacA subfamily drug resistance transporter
MSQSDAQLLPGAAPAETKAAGRPLDHALVRQIIVGILLAMFLSALEQTIVAPALPTIGRVLADVENLSFVVTAYLLAATAVTPLFGKLADIHGRRAAMLVAVAIFILGSVACALAPTMGALIAARALQGIGGGGILPIAQTIIADLLAPRERPMYQSYSAVMFMAASVLGPVLGGLLTDYLHWSLIFWINVPMGAVALVMTDRALRRLPRYERPHRLDLLGAALMVAAALMLMVALAWGGRRYLWGSPEIVAMIAASVLLWGLFALRLARAPEPFIPPGMLRDRVVRAILVTAFFAIGAIIGLTIMTPLYLSLVLGLNASQSSLALIALVVGTTFGSVIAGRLLGRLKRYKRVPVASLAIAVASVAALAVNPAGLSLVGVSAILFLVGTGVGPMYPVTTVVIQNVVPPHHTGTATGTLNFFRQLGGAIIVAAFGAIVLGALGGAGDAAALEMLAGANRTGVDFAATFRWVFVAAAIFLGLAALAMMAVEERPLRGRGEALNPQRADHEKTAISIDCRNSVRNQT